MLNYKLRPLIELINEKYRFFVPAYQRGYKWTRLEVLKLMNDIWDFKNYRAEKDNNAFYCLQPIVVRHFGSDYHVIDGQQRLTTLLIIQQAILNTKVKVLNDYQSTNFIPICGKTYSINYATRENSDNWLPLISNDSKMQDNSDYYHFHEAYKAAMDFLTWIDSYDPDYELDGKRCPNQESEAVNTFSKIISL